MKKYWLLVISFVVSVFVNFLANYIKFNGLTTADVSAMHPTYFTPAGYVFIIWGVIYLSFAFMLYVVGRNMKKYEGYINATFLWYLLLNIANTLWIFAWHYGYFLISVVLTLTMLSSLLKVYIESSKLIKEKSAVTFTNSVYLGWISVATIANIAVYLKTFSISNWGMPETYYASIMIVVAFILGLFMVVKKRDFVYFGVIVWAIVGILVNFSTLMSIVLPSVLGLSISLTYLVYTYGQEKKLRDLDSN